MTYTITLDGLSSATIYYYRVSATFDVIYSRYSEVSLFRTKENGKCMEFVTFLHSLTIFFRARILFRIPTTRQHQH